MTGMPLRWRDPLVGSAVSRLTIHSTLAGMTGVPLRFLFVGANRDSLLRLACLATRTRRDQISLIQAFQIVATPERGVWKKGEKSDKNKA